MKKFYTYAVFIICLLFVSVCLPQTAAQAKLYHGIVRYNEKTKTLTIPKDLDSIPPGILSSCMAEKMTVAPGNRYFMVKDNVLFSKDGSSLVYYLPLKKDRVYRIPGSVTSIEPMAFANNWNIRQVILHKNLKALGSGAFVRCNSLEKINLQDAVKLKKITDCHTEYPLNSVTDGDYEITPYREYIPVSKYESWARDCFYQGTFEGTKISSIQIPDNVAYLSEETFRSCGCLRKISFGKHFSGGINTPADNPGKTLLLYWLNLDSLKFKGKNPKYCIKDNVLYSADGTILCQVLDDKYTRECKEKDFVIGREVTQIADGAFYHLICLDSITVEGTLTSIGRSAFFDCSIKTFLARGDIAYIGKGAFRHCGNLQSFLCKGKVGIVDTEAFFCAYQMKEALAGQLPDQVDDTAFSECAALPDRKFSLLPSGRL